MSESFKRQKSSRWDLAATLVLWLVAVSERIRGAGIVQAALANNMDVLSVSQCRSKRFGVSNVVSIYMFCMLPFFFLFSQFWLSNCIHLLITQLIGY